MRATNGTKKTATTATTTVTHTQHSIARMGAFLFVSMWTCSGHINSLSRIANNSNYIRRTKRWKKKWGSNQRNKPKIKTRRRAEKRDEKAHTQRIRNNWTKNRIKQIKLGSRFGGGIFWFGFGCVFFSSFMYTITAHNTHISSPATSYKVKQMK